MRHFRRGWLKTSVAQFLRLAALRGIHDGTSRSAAYLESCTASYPDEELLHVLAFSRDKGMYDCGWWKNAQYEQCYHLSLSFRDAAHQSIPQQHDLAHEWARLFFGEHTKLLWVEPPYYDVGKAADAYHYRLFTDENWQPILPKGEVYSTDWTPKGWLSFSDLQDKLKREQPDDG